MTPSLYYQQVKLLAQQIRAEFGLNTPRVLKSDLRRIYKAKGISKIDLWPPRGQKIKLRQLRGAYLHDTFGATVMLARSLPEEPMVFTMAHELKHHLMDKDLPIAYCDKSNENEMIEIGAEIFAAELIFPDSDFSNHMASYGIELGKCLAKDIVKLKHESRTTLSFTALAKKAEFLRFAPKQSLQGISWKKLAESIYGEPAYKRIARYRKLKKLTPRF